MRVSDTDLRLAEALESVRGDSVGRLLGNNGKTGVFAKLHLGGNTRMSLPKLPY